MIRFKKILFGFVGAYICAALSVAQAQDAPGPDANPSQQMHSDQRQPGLFARLNLTPDQQQQLEANKQQHRVLMKSLHQQMKADREALREALMSPQLNMAQVNQIHSQIKAIEAQVEDASLSSILTVRSILTPDQFSLFLIMMDKHKPAHPQGPPQ